MDLHPGACVSRLLSGLVVAVRGSLEKRASAFDHASTAELVLELDHAADGEERLAVLLAVESGEHAGVVVEGGDRGAEALAERLAARSAAEVVELKILERAGLLARAEKQQGERRVYLIPQPSLYWEMCRTIRDQTARKRQTPRPRRGTHRDRRVSL